jgi:hypothetical protein
MVDNSDIERRIRERMERLWRENGEQGDSEAFRAQARLLVAIEDTQESTLRPVEEPAPEPAEPVRNLGEFPTTTDQDEGEAFPSREFIPDKG